MKTENNCLVLSLCLCGYCLKLFDNSFIKDESHQSGKCRLLWHDYYKWNLNWFSSKTKNISAVQSSCPYLGMNNLLLNFTAFLDSLLFILSSSSSVPMNFIFRQHRIFHSICRFVGMMFPLSSCSFSHLFSSMIMFPFCLYYTLLSPLTCWMRNFSVLWLFTNRLSQGKNLFYLSKIYQHKNFYCIFISFLLYHWILTMFTIIVKFIFIHICVCLCMYIPCVWGGL